MAARGATGCMRAYAEIEEQSAAQSARNCARGRVQKYPFSSRKLLILSKRTGTPVTVFLVLGETYKEQLSTIDEAFNV